MRDLALDERSKINFDGWPDCYEVSQNIQSIIETEYDSLRAEIKEFRFDSGFRHYALTIRDENTGESMIIDASYAQFAEETDVPIDMNKSDSISDVVIASPKQQYVFWRNLSLKDTR